MAVDRINGGQIRVPETNKQWSIVNVISPTIDNWYVATDRKRRLWHRSWYFQRYDGIVGLAGFHLIKNIGKLAQPLSMNCSK